MSDNEALRAALKAAILAESVYNLVNLQGDQLLAGIPEALLAVWTPDPIEVSAETVAAAAERLIAEKLLELRDGVAAVPNRGPRGRAPVIHVDYQTGQLRRGPPK